MECPIIFENRKLVITRPLTAKDFGYVSPYATNAMDYFFNDNPDGWTYEIGRKEYFAEFKIRFLFFEVIDKYIKEKDVQLFNKEYMRARDTEKELIKVYLTDLKRVIKETISIPLKKGKEEKTKIKLQELGKQREEEVFQRAIFEISKTLESIQKILS